MPDHKKILDSVLPKLKKLPARPASHLRVAQALDDPSQSSDEIACKINQDVALTAHLLKMANSAAFGSAERISSTRDAVSLVGTLRLKALVTTAWAFQLIDENTKVLGFNPKAEWDHALEAGNLCMAMARETGMDIRESEATFTAAILHDLGKILLATNCPDYYAAVSEETAERANVPRHQVEREMLGFDHADIGSRLLEDWGMPADVVQAVRWHHQPETQDLHTLSPLILVHVADCKIRNLPIQAGCQGRYCAEKVNHLAELTA